MFSVLDDLIRPICETSWLLVLVSFLIPVSYWHGFVDLSFFLKYSFQPSQLGSVVELQPMKQEVMVQFQSGHWPRLRLGPSIEQVSEATG